MGTVPSSGGEELVIFEGENYNYIYSSLITNIYKVTAWVSLFAGISTTK